MHTKNNQFIAIIVMGVSGCGKTTIGKMLAEKLGMAYMESDNYHSKEDIQKMSSGIPLTDEDRWPWLFKLHASLVENERNGQSVVLACSALKASYRQLLAENLKNVWFVYLKGSFKLIFERMQSRQHYMKADMLQSQFEDLEEPDIAIFIDINNSPDQIVNEIINHLSIREGSRNLQSKDS